MSAASPMINQTDDPLKKAATAGLASRLLFPVLAVVLLVWGIIIALGDPVKKEAFDPTKEFDLSHGVIFGDLGFFTFNKGVIYLLIAMTFCILFAVYVNKTIVRRLKQETKTQSIIEGVYEFSYDMLAEPLPKPHIFNRYMPYVASIFLFIWFLNMTSFVPLPLNNHANIGGIGWLYAFGIYAVTSNIFCTATLALATFVIYHVEGVRAHGLGGYLKTWTAGQKGAAGAFVWVIEALTNLALKPLSLAVRLFANMLSGHILILLMLALAGIVGGAAAVSILAQTAGTIVALLFYLFEMVLVATLQAFIFAILSAIYIGSAAEEHH